MIIGRFGPPSSAKEDSDNIVREVNFLNRDFGVYFNGHGEKNYVMSNDYYVVPNVKPGRYYLAGFSTDTVKYKLFTKKDSFEIKPGQIVYLGSLDFVTQEQSFSDRFHNRVKYELKKAPHPTELEMLQWLKKIDAGSGWERTINKRVRELSR